MATLKQIWVDSKGIEHDTEREADLQDLIYISEASVDVWLAQQEGLKRPSQYARVLKMWERDRIRRDYEYKETRSVVREQTDEHAVEAPSKSLFNATLLDDDDFDFKEVTMIRV